MSYEVFARKYRPQTLDDLVGQEHVKRTLSNAIAQNRLAHAYLFVGPRGTGKTSTARILAKSLNCVKGPTVTPCGVCDPCREIAAGTSFGVFEYDAASNTQVDKIRELIIERARVAPSQGYRYKMYIIDEVHMLSGSSFNALLKTLEEPPPRVIFVFATTEVHKVPLTIVSRCQRFDLHRIPSNLIAKQLLDIAQKEKIALEPSAAHAVARAAEGGMRDAESMLDQLVAFCGEKISEADVLNVFGLTSEFTVAQFTEQMLRRNTVDALNLLHSEADNGKDMMKLMSDLISHLRDLLVFKVKPDAVSDEVDPELQKCFERAAALVETDRLLELIDQFAAGEGRMKWAPNKKLHFEVAIIKAIQTLNQVTLDQVIENLSALRDGKAPDLAAVAAVAGRGRATSEERPTTAATPTPTASPKAAEDSRPYNAPVAGDVDGKVLWAKTIEQVAKRRPLIHGWLDAATPLVCEGRFLTIGFPPEQKTAMESLSFPRNREFIESILKEISGRELKLKLELKEGLPNKKPAEPPSERSNPQENFRDDPLIREALEIFQGEIKS